MEYIDLWQDGIFSFPFFFLPESVVNLLKVVLIDKFKKTSHLDFFVLFRNLSIQQLFVPRVSLL